MERLAEFVLRHRRLVVLSWAVVLLAGAVAAGRVGDRLTFDFSLPGQPGYETEVDVAELYDTSTFDTYVPVVTVPEGTTVQEQRAEVAAVFDTVRAEVPGVRVTDLASSGDERFVGEDGRTTYALVQGPLPTGFEPGTALALEPVLERAAAAAGVEVALTSYGLLSAGGEVEGPSVLVETLIGATGALVLPVFDLRIGQSDLASLSRSGPAYEALGDLRAAGVAPGVLTPITVLVPADEAAAAAEAAREVDGVFAAVAADPRGGRTLVDVLPERETVDSDGTAVVAAVRSAVEAAVDGDVGLTGAGPTVEDYGSAVYDNFPYVLLLISVITFVLLVRTFRSVLLPLKAVLLNLLSLAAVFGAVVFFWQQGNGSDALFGVSPTGAITFWLPVLIFAFLFGLSMDYEVFILARMREEYDATGSTSAAVVTGIGRTGRLVTSAALILFFAFAALASAPGTDIKVLGTALGVGILIDATLVRALLVPAAVSLFGRWNWWLPVWLARVLRVEPSPLTAREVPGLPAQRSELAGLDAPGSRRM